MFRPLKFLLSAPKCMATHRCCSGFVSRMRYLNRLKEDDNACAAALQDGHIFLYHQLSPLLQRTERGSLKTAALTCTDVLSILDRLGSDRALLKESILIGCSEQKQAQFCLDVGDLDQATVEEEFKAKFIDMRKAFFLLRGAEAPLVAKGQALLRWHQTNKFCSATGQPTTRNQAGSQRFCSSSNIVYYPKSFFTAFCPPNQLWGKFYPLLSIFIGLSMSHALLKMSPVVIVLVSDGKHCLLGRQATFPPGLYSALAGFCDMGETLEETLSREVAEEVGLEVNSVSYSSSQHWPFPHSSFMVGCHASVSRAHTELKVDHAELEDARWFTVEEITAALKVKTPPRRGDPPALWLPPKHALANRLITEWVEQQRCGKEGQQQSS